MVHKHKTLIHNLNTYITCRLPVSQKYHMKVFRHLYFYHDLSENIIYQKKNGMNGNILRVCRCFNKKVLLHSYVKNQTNNFSKFLVNRFVWWETDWFLFEVCGAHREARQIKEVFGCNMLIYFRNDHHFVATTYIFHLYDENQLDFKCYSHIRAISNIFYLPTYIWKESMFILYWAPRMISPFPYIEHANFRLLICLFHFNNNEGYPNFYWH